MQTSLSGVILPFNGYWPVVVIVFRDVVTCTGNAGTSSQEPCRRGSEHRNQVSVVPIPYGAQMLEVRRTLESSLRDVQGYFSEDEAWALYKAVGAVLHDAGPTRVVEIGSYKGRSTIVIGLALLGHDGDVVSVDLIRMGPA